MPVRVYDAPYPAPFFPQQNVFQYLFPEGPGISPLETFDESLPAFIDGKTGRTLSRGDLKTTALRVAAALRGADLGGHGTGLGLRKGDVACIWGFNSLEWVIAAYSCMAAGVTLSPGNAGYAPSELAHQINDSGASLIFLAPSHMAAFDEARPLLKREFPHSRVVLLTDPTERFAGPYKTLYDILPAGGSYRAERFDRADSHATAWLCYSSGTTGLPKGVMTSHYNMTSELQAISKVYQIENPAKESVLGVLPMSHMYGLALLLHHPLMVGMPAVLYPKFEEAAALAGIEKYRITFAMFVPPIVLLLYHSKLAEKHDLTSLSWINCGAAPLSAELCEAFERRFPHVCITQGWGLTESSVSMSLCAPRSKGPKNAVGQVIPTWEVRLVADGKDVPEGEEGEIWGRSPALMEGYHNNPKATADTMAPGGWFKTGDVGRIDKHGNIYIVDRIKELIKYKGYQVAPAELEALLLQCPGVTDCGVIGVYSEEQATELPRAYVVADDSTTAEAVAEWVNSRVSNPKKLRGGVILVDAIPKSPSGKILRKELRERAKKEQGRDQPRAKL